MSGVIFDGVLGTPTSRSAYVKLLFDNSDRKIPVDTDVVTLSRRVNRKGFSKYMLNSETVSRSQLVDILGMARLYSSGYNLIIQGTITKLADTTPEERRRVIEGLVGIAEYNAKKTEARSQLRQAETNLRIADARIGDVQYRLERLEEERNDALRYNFIQEEIRKLQAILTSNSIIEIENEKKELVDELQLKRSTVEDTKEQGDNLQRRRREVESARRRFDEEVADKGSRRLHLIQKRIGEIMANMASLKMENTSGKISLRGLTKIREERVQQLTSLKKAIQESKRSLSELKTERNKLKIDIDETSLKDTTLTNKLTDLKQNLSKNTVKMRELEAELNRVERQMFKLDNQLKSNTAKQGIISNNLKNLEERRVTFRLMMKDLEAHFHELQRLQKEEQERFAKAASSLEKARDRKNDLPLEMEKAEKTIQMAKSAMIEFETWKEFIEKLATEDVALKRIEEMGQAGAISGIIGSLENLVKFESKFRKALTVAASGWLKAVVVNDLKTALHCVESLKKMKIGRIKLIPLREVNEVEVKEIPNGSGIIGLAAELVKCDEKYLGAVNFVFGDTIIASGEKSAFLASQEGFRVVDLKGGLYEAGGGIESGFYRSPIDIFSLLPSEIAVGSLTKSVQSLEQMLVKRKRDFNDINDEVMGLREEQVKRIDVTNSIARDIDLVSENIVRTKRNIRTLNKRVKRLNTYLDRGKIIQSPFRSRKAPYLKSLRSLRSQKKKLDVAVDKSNVETYENEQTHLNSVVNELNRRFLKIESGINFLETKLNITLHPEHKRVKLDIQTLTRQINRLNKNVTTAQSRLEEAAKQLSELEKSKENLSESLISVKGQRMDFERQLDEIDLQIKQVSQEYEPLMRSIHTLDLEVQRKNLKCEGLKNELLQLGHKAPVSIDVKEMKNLVAALDLMRFEFEQLGSVNQLAPAHYDDQQSNYKQLSVRRNQLEGERGAILEFIDEIERKKRAVFLEAYDRVNESFSFFFERLTGGGRGWLNLEKPENPFSGGLDIFAQFPGKASRLIASASGGEKSVVAVAFIFAIQSLSPAAFYVFDEIDAHLDPYNAERLADLLKEQSSNSQFIVITLRDVVIDRAEKLFGVYVQSGISQIVSTKMEEVLPRIV